MKRLLLTLVLALLPSWALAALDTATGTITVSTGAVGTTFTVSGLSFQPEAIYFSWTGVATLGGAEGDGMAGQGLAVSTSSRRSYTTQFDHGNAAIATDGAWYNDCVVSTLTIAGALDGKADLDAITSDGFRLIVDDQFALAVVVGWIAWGGTDLTNAEIVDITEPGATGDQTVSTSFALNTGIDDKAVILIGTGRAAAGSIATSALMQIGFAAGDTISNGGISGSSQDAPGGSATVSCGYIYSSLIGVAHVDTVVSRASITAWLAGGFTLNWAEVYATDTLYFSALVLKGGRWYGDYYNSSTGTGETDEATTYVPKSIMFASRNTALSTLDTSTGQNSLSIGAAQSASSRWVGIIQDKDAAATEDVYRYTNDIAYYANASTATTQAIEALADIVDFVPASGNGFTWVMDDADVGTYLVFYLVASDVPPVCTAGLNLPLLGVGGCP